ncbi:MAG: asparagine synthase B [Elusimicrobia bacterium]|nr:asparagine synthase B [Elusimicrobiota bacterium]
MCGILCVLDIKEDAAGLRKKALAQVKKLRHRGPDWSGVYSDERAILCHERLSIVDVEHGAQPLVDAKTSRVLSVNGEIYNHKELTQTLKKPHDFRTASDCEPILYLYDEQGPDFIKRLNGIFAFVLYDPKNDEYLIARDPIGVVPLYWGHDAEGHMYVASELKAVSEVCLKVEQFPPGHYYLSREKKTVKYYNPKWAEPGHIPSAPLDLKALRESLEAAVRRQLMCDVPYGLLISGGVDSSIIAAIAAKYRTGRVEADGKEPAWWPQLHSFSVGLENAPDLKYARKVAGHIGSIHHEIHFTVQEGIDAVPDVIYHLETFDVTSIRAATPMYLMARKIRAMGIKMILSGEGADEIFGGYLYFHKAPDRKEFHEETVRKLGMLHMYDCLRANKAVSAWGVEARVPFLDVEFLETAMNLDPAEKMITKDRKEKWMLRKAFEGYIPDEILWRQKEQFSDGVGYGWIDSLKAHAEKEVADRMLKNAAHRFPDKTPVTKEGFLYRSIFEGLFPNPSAALTVPDGPSVACSTPTAIRWDKSFQEMQDPSGRAVKNVHEKSY